LLRPFILCGGGGRGARPSPTQGQSAPTGRAPLPSKQISALRLCPLTLALRYPAGAMVSGASMRRHRACPCGPGCRTARPAASRCNSDTKFLPRRGWIPGQIRPVRQGASEKCFPAKPRATQPTAALRARLSFVALGSSRDRDGDRRRCQAQQGCRTGRVEAPGKRCTRSTWAVATPWVSPGFKSGASRDERLLPCLVCPVCAPVVADSHPHCGSA
jgi:hypothetical protein